MLLPARLSLVVLVFTLVGMACGGEEGSEGDDESSGDTSVTSEAGDAGGEPCGGEFCAEDEACDMVGPDCEELAAEDSTCRFQAEDCLYEEDVWEPVCLCDGIVRPFDCGYFNSTSLEACDQIQCGPKTCDKATEYCQVTDPSGFGGDFVCMPLPATCGAEPSCGCLSAEACGQSCKGEATAGFRLVCN